MPFSKFSMACCSWMYSVFIIGFNYESLILSAESERYALVNIIPANANCYAKTFSFQ